MNITVNGKSESVERELTVRALLDKLNVGMKQYVTVQLNDEIISTNDFDTVVVKENDNIEFLYFMGGGAV